MISPDKTITEFIRTGDWEPLSICSSYINGDILTSQEGVEDLCSVCVDDKTYHWVGQCYNNTVSVYKYLQEQPLHLIYTSTVVPVAFLLKLYLKNRKQKYYVPGFFIAARKTN